VGSGNIPLRDGEVGRWGGGYREYLRVPDSPVAVYKVETFYKAEQKCTGTIWKSCKEPAEAWNTLWVPSLILNTNFISNFVHVQ
jgi:hypothetical protein